MGRFRNLKTDIVVSVDDSKDDRFVSGWESTEGPAKRAPGRPKKSDD
jgi:hypothetical protein